MSIRLEREINDLRESLRSLLLPLAVDEEAACMTELARILSDLNLQRDDFGIWLHLEFDAWQDTGEPTKKFRALVRSLIARGHPEFGPLICKKYFEIHAALREQALLSHAEASMLLSHTVLIVRLSREEVMSSAQIARLLRARDQRVGFSRQSVDVVVGKLKTKRGLNQTDIADLFERDKQLEESIFSDAGLGVSADIVARRGAFLGYPGDLKHLLNTLAPEEQLSTFTPYLQILHYQCTIAEFVDHSVTDLYEFSPRGRHADWLFDQYPKGMVSARNPFLNNAKSVEQATLEWARSKKQAELPGAIALVELLQGLDSMGFAARKELSSIVRQWLFRVMRIAKPIVAVLPRRMESNQIVNVYRAVAICDTHTSGIIERNRPVIPVVAGMLW